MSVDFPGAPHAVRSLRFAPYQIISHQILFMGSQGKYLLSFKNEFENLYFEEKMYPFREVKDSWVRGVGEPLPLRTFKSCASSYR